MLKKIIKTYYRLLDEKLENWTIVVLIIATLIISASLITDDTNANLLVKSNVLENSKQNQNFYNIIEIDWTQYKIILEEYKK
jgi:hypothetical protein